jgi:hypothetical protein
MEDLIKILTREDYIKSQINGVEPLLDPAFDIEINLRKQLQNELFGEDGSDPFNRRAFFKWVWENRPHVCEETGAFLGYTMQAEFMSHILSRGAHIEMWHDPRNINLLVPDAHRKWETGKREKMKIWDKNKVIVARLKADYSQLKTYNAFPAEKSKSATSFVDKLSKLAKDIDNECRIDDDVSGGYVPEPEKSWLNTIYEIINEYESGKL